MAGSLALILSVVVALFQSRINVDDLSFSWNFTLPVVLLFGLALLLNIVGICLLLREREQARLDAMGRDAEITAIRATQDEIRGLLRRREMRQRHTDRSGAPGPYQDRLPIGALAVWTAVALSLLLGSFSHWIVLVPGTPWPVPLAMISSLAAAILIGGTLVLWAVGAKRSASQLRALYETREKAAGA